MCISCFKFDIFRWKTYLSNAVNSPDEHIPILNWHSLAVLCIVGGGLVGQECRELAIKFLRLISQRNLNLENFFYLRMTTRQQIRDAVIFLEGYQQTLTTEDLIKAKRGKDGRLISFFNSIETILERVPVPEDELNRFLIAAAKERSLSEVVADLYAKSDVVNIPSVNNDAIVRISQMDPNDL